MPGVLLLMCYTVKNKFFKMKSQVSSQIVSS